MALFLFRSQQDPNVFCFTPDKGGRNLPAAFGPWEDEATHAMSSSATDASEAVRSGIRSSGYFIGRA